MQVKWGKISMVDAERRLLANALQDPENQRFVLLSERQLIKIKILVNYFNALFLYLNADELAIIYQFLNHFLVLQLCTIVYF